MIPMVIGVFPTPYCERSSIFNRAKTAPTGFADGYIAANYFMQRSERKRLTNVI
jgi:hypothetical protein